MQIRLPFTNVKLTLGQSEEFEARGYSSGRFAAIPQTDKQGHKIDRTALYQVWRQNTDVFACVREIRQNVGIGGSTWFDPNDEKRERPASPSLVKQVEDIMSYSYGSITGFKNAAFNPKLISGDCFIELIRNPLGEIIGTKVLDSRTIAVVSDEFGRVYFYVQTKTGYDSKIVDPVIFMPDDIIHWKNGHDPDNEVFGFSPIEPVILDVRADVSAAQSNYYFFQNSATPSIQYIMEPNLDGATVQKFVDNMKKNFGGAKNKHKAAVLQGVKEIKPVALSHREMEYLEGRKFVTEKICSAFGVPKVMLGYTDNVNYTNHEGQMTSFYEGTIRDEELSFEQSVVAEIITRLDIQNQIAFAFKPAQFESRNTVWDRAIRARQTGLITINNARKMLGMDPIDPSLHGDAGDRIITGDGASAVFLDDIGVDPQIMNDEFKSKLLNFHSINPSNVHERSY